MSERRCDKVGKNLNEDKAVQKTSLFRGVGASESADGGAVEEQGGCWTWRREVFPLFSGRVIVECVRSQIIGDGLEVRSRGCFNVLFFLFPAFEPLTGQRLIQLSHCQQDFSRRPNTK